MAVPISAYMLTYNNEASLERALESVAFADEIVVVDSYSSDGTLEVAERYTDKVVQRAWPGFRDQYQFAQDQCTNDWVLFIDADEEVSEPLAEEIQTVLLQNAKLPEQDQIHGFRVQRRSFFMDRWILHGSWVPDREIRVYDRNRGQWRGDLHANVKVEGNVGDLWKFYYHFTYENIAAQINTLNSYSSEAAKDLDNDGAGGNVFHMLFNPPFRFFREYILKGGFLDGIPGFVIAMNNSFYVFNKYAKLWERRRCTPEQVERGRKRRRP